MDGPSKLSRVELQLHTQVQIILRTTHIPIGWRIFVELVSVTHGIIQVITIQGNADVLADFVAQRQRQGAIAFPIMQAVVDGDIASRIFGGNARF